MISRKLVLGVSLVISLYLSLCRCGHCCDHYSASGLRAGQVWLRILLPHRFELHSLLVLDSPQGASIFY